jgi:hypothetical protein
MTRAWRSLSAERRLAALAAALLVLTLFLPWYRDTVFVPAKRVGVQAASVTLSGWSAFSFVEGLLLIVAVGVLAFLFQRAEGRGLDIPEADGWLITGAGAFACLLVIWRIFDTQSASSHNRYATSSGITWGILVALGAAALLSYAGSRLRGTDAATSASAATTAGAPNRAGGPAGTSPEAGQRRGGPDVVGAPHVAGGRARRPDRTMRRRFGPLVVPEDPPTLRVPEDPPTLRVPEDPPTLRVRKAGPANATAASGPDGADALAAPTVGNAAAPPSAAAGRDSASAGPDEQLIMPLENPSAGDA